MVICNPDTLEPLISADVCTFVETTGAVQWSAYPVESGAPSADFASIEPRTYTARVLFVSNGDAARIGAIVESLFALKDACAPVVVVLTDTSPKVVISSVRVTREAKADEVEVEIGFRQWATARWEYVQIPPELLAAEALHAQAKAQGVADSATADDTQESGKRKSVAAKIVDGDFGNLADDWGF
jgi:hypothetical protein